MIDNNNSQTPSTTIETSGIEQIPACERHADPADLLRLNFGGANFFSSAVLGSFPMLFGLSFEAGLWAIGLVVLDGSLSLVPMGLCFINLPGQFPVLFDELFDGIVVSLLLTLAAVSYLILLRLFTEPATVLGPQGPL